MPLLPIALISCAALGLEILLMRLFSIVQWHHFAYLAVSLAMLGYGAAGTVLAIAGDRFRRHFHAIFAASALLCGLSMPLAFLTVQAVPFNALEILWDERQWLWLAVQYLVLFIPFFFAAFCLCLSFSCFGAESHRIYGADLWGASAGGVLALGLLFVLPPLRTLLVVSALALLASALVLPRRRVAHVLLLAALALPWAVPDRLLELRPSPYKPLSQILLLPGAKMVMDKHGPLGEVSVVKSPDVPLRYAPGLSLAATREPPAQLGVFVDGEGLAALTRFDGSLEQLGFLGQMPSATPYQVSSSPRVLVMGAGTGMDVLQALYFGASRVDAVELDADVAAVASREYASYAGHIFQNPRVRLHVGEARSYVARSQDVYDLIVLPLTDTMSATSAGLYGLAEDYLHTVEAFRTYFHHLSPEGKMVFNRWIQIPPRDLIKLAATAVEALAQEGVAHPMRHLALLRGWQTAVLMVKRSPFSAGEVASLQAFAENNAFDLEWAGGKIDRQGAVPHHRLDRDYFTDAFVALSGSAAMREEFYRRYKFDIVPPDDDHPYFSRFFTWRAMPEILRLKGRGGLPLMEMGYPVLVATWLQSIVFGGLLILLPLWVARRREMPATAGRRRVFGYFAALGMAFMLLEMAFLQKFVLLLGHPLYAAVAALTAFLFFAGLGSRYSARLADRGLKSPVLLPVAGILTMGLLYQFMLPMLTPYAVGWPLAYRLVLGVLLVAPLSFCMGMPFPLGMTRVAATSSSLLPWAYGVNACFSVMSAPFATLLAIEIGFGGVVLTALGTYVLAAWLFPPGVAQPGLRT